MFNLVIFGPPGTGKGTQSRRIEEKYGIRHLCSGDIMRREIVRNTDDGRLIKPFVDQGLLVPDKMVLRKVYCEVIDTKSEKGFVFDGFPRTIKQAEITDRWLQRAGISINMVINIEVEHDEIIHRLRGRALDSGRSDDKEEIIQKRLKVYQLQTQTLISYYQKSERLFKVNGMAETKEVFRRICLAIDDYLFKNKSTIAV